MFGVILSRLYNKAHCNSNNETPHSSFLPPPKPVYSLTNNQTTFTQQAKEMLWTIFIIIIMIHLK